MGWAIVILKGIGHRTADAADNNTYQDRHEKAGGIILPFRQSIRGLARYFKFAVSQGKVLDSSRSELFLKKSQSIANKPRYAKRLTSALCLTD